MEPMRVKHLVPNAVTLANIALGFLSIIAAARGEYERAAWLIFGGALCDLCDGRLARLLDASSKFGMELDSLSDAISFGLAPAVLLYFAALKDLGAVGAAIAVGYVLCAVLRLARYNVETGALAQVTFEGCPTPIAAGYMISFIMVRGELSRAALAVGTAALAIFMVSKLKIPKFRKGSGLPIAMLLAGLGLFIFFLFRPTAVAWHVWNGWNWVMIFANYVFLARRGHLRQNAEPLRRAA
jgi:CDP-diacylglycerol--serine O-phosphatidyltransferase